MDAPELEREANEAPASDLRTSRERAPGNSFWNSCRQGAKTGIRWMWIILGPVWLLGLILLVVLPGFGLQAGSGLSVVSIARAAVGSFLVCTVWGSVIGAVVGATVFLIRRLRGRHGPGGTSVSADRSSPVGPGRVAAGLLLETTTDEAAFSRRQPRRLWPWFVGVPVLVLLTAALGTFAFLKRTVDRRLAAAIAAADRDDPQWRLDDLMVAREQVPDDENSALVVAEVVSMLPESWQTNPGRPPGTPRPPPSEVLQAFTRVDGMVSNERLEADTAAFLRAELAASSDAVQLARTVANSRRGSHPLHLASALIDTPLKETEEARSVARLLAVDAAIRAEDGDIDGALDSCRAIFGVSRSIGDELFMISKIVRIWMGEIALRSVRRALAQGEPSDASLAKLQALVIDELAQPHLLQAAEGERAVLDEIIRRVRDAEIPISALSGSMSIDETRPLAPWGKVLFDNYRGVGLELMNEMVAIARQPYFKQPALWEALESKVVRIKNSRFGPYVATLPIVMMPANTAYGAAQFRYNSELGAMAILLAAERHRKKTGTWPESIAAIDPSFLRDPPLDPFSGKPLRVERRDGQFLLYSIGPNRQDEHGEYEPKGWKSGTYDDYGTGAWDVPLRKQPPRE